MESQYGGFNAIKTIPYGMHHPVISFTPCNAVFFQIRVLTYENIFNIKCLVVSGMSTKGNLVQPPPSFEPATNARIGEKRNNQSS